jgi:hypothetical protein
MYHENLLNLCFEALFNLYFTVQSNDGYTSSSARNAILVKFLKSKLKLAAYKDQKKNIQLLVRLGRNKNKKLELELLEIKKRAFDVYNAPDS